MKKNIQGFILGILIYSLLISCGSFALNLQKEIDVTYRDIKLSVDEEYITPRDVNGNIVEPFIYNGTTYLPVRAVGEALDRVVSWDNERSAVHIDEKKPEETFFYDLTPVQISEKGDFYKDYDGTNRYIGFAPSNSFQTLDIYGWRNFECRVIYSLNGKAKRIAGTIVPPTLPKAGLGSFRIEIRNEKGTVLYKSKPLGDDDSPIEFELNTTGIKNLMIDFIGSCTTYSEPCIVTIKNLIMQLN
ncbi:MAG: hypothetical protein IJN09_02065 [Oscillospiraceae bacterium]|nr:hypothetical protein [Oscillospiraceae bacterium]